MNKSTIALAVAVVGIAGLVPGSPVTREAHAAGIQRCAAPDGSTLYTDQPCAVHGATPIAMTGELSARLLDARQAEGDAGGSIGALGQYADASLPLSGSGTRPSVARRSAASGCARSPTQLAMDLQGAFALGDVNRIAESYHWVGMDQDGAIRTMKRLEQLAMSTLVDTQFHDATILSARIGTYADAGASLASAGGIMQVTLAGEGGSHLLDLDVERYEGCYFVRF